jgi:hypothetical protein
VPVFGEPETGSGVVMKGGVRVPGVAPAFLETERLLLIWIASFLPCWGLSHIRCQQMGPCVACAS